MWSEYQRRWPPEERAPLDRSADPPGSWRGDGNRFLDRAENSRVEAACDRIAEQEEQKISPALRAIESQDPDRHLIGFDDRLKGRDRIKEKVCRMIEELSFSPEQAVSLVPDAVRYTFQYQEARYTQGVQADIARMKDQGFELTNSRIPGRMISTRASTASGSSPIPASGSKCSFILASASKRSSSRIVPTNGSAPSSPISSSRWCWKPSKRKLLPRCRFRPVLKAFLTTRREAQMPDKVTYYAIVDDLSSRERPAGVFRRTYTDDGGRRDEAFTRISSGSPAASLISAERGDLQNEFIEITEDEANQIVERIRAKVTGANNG